VARYFTYVESTTAVVGSTQPTGGTPNSLFANLVSSTTMPLKIRRITVGVRAGTGAPTSQQMTVGLIRTTARGTATTTFLPRALDGANTSTAFSPGIDTAWSAVPTATWPPTSSPWVTPTNYVLDAYSFNTQATLDLPYELLEELIVSPAASNANGLAFYNLQNALPTSHLYTLRVEWEE
jgi:hypothetical protein